MGDKSAIEWTEATWNPTTGCDKVSPGCDHCYALSLAPRLKAMGSKRYQRDGDPVTSGPGFGLSVHSDALPLPLRWTKPRRIFVNSMSDLFHAEVPDRFIADVFAVMSLAKQHTFQLLTKRHGRMRSLLNSGAFWIAVNAARMARGVSVLPGGGPVVLPNVWIGVSVEDQKRAELRIPALLDTPAAVRWLSCEPLLGPIDLGIDDPHAGHDSDDVHGHPHPRVCLTCSTDDNDVEYFRRNPVRAGFGLDWVVVGGESGRNARPMQPGWARVLRDQCTAAGVPFFFKQWGQWAPDGDAPCAPGQAPNNHSMVWCKSKHDAGRELDGRTWDEYPQ